MGSNTVNSDHRYVQALVEWEKWSPWGVQDIIVSGWQSEVNVREQVTEDSNGVEDF